MSFNGIDEFATDMPLMESFDSMSFNGIDEFATDMPLMESGDSMSFYGIDLKIVCLYQNLIIK